MARFFSLFLLLSAALLAEKIETFYGAFEVEEPVLLELIYAPSFQRLKAIHQYGVSYYTTFREEYTRYDHSLGVWAILRRHGASLEEQIAGLLHDVSHTVFSHVGDWIFQKQNQEEDYQTKIHDRYLVESGLEAILKRHGFTIEAIHPKNSHHRMLEQPLPDLCADRIDYNIQGAYHQNFVTKEEALELFEKLQYLEGRWVVPDLELMGKVARFSLYMTEHCWGSALNHLTSTWLAEAILRGIDVGLFTWHDIHFGVDEIVWQKLTDSKDSSIKECMQKVLDPHPHFQLTATGSNLEVIPFKCRGIDPWIIHEKEPKRLSSLDTNYAEQLNRLKALSQMGWSIKKIPQVSQTSGSELPFQLIETAK